MDVRRGGDSQIEPYSRKTTTTVPPNWPLIDHAYRMPKTRGELLVLCPQLAWIADDRTGLDQIFAMW